MPAAAQRSTAATEPQVPGPGLPSPAPKKVATVQAQIVRVLGGFLGWGAGMAVELFVIAIVASPAEFAEVLVDLGVEYR